MTRVKVFLCLSQLIFVVFLFLEWVTEGVTGFALIHEQHKGFLLQSKISRQMGDVATCDQLKIAGSPIIVAKPIFQKRPNVVLEYRRGFSSTNFVPTETTIRIRCISPYPIRITLDSISLHVTEPLTIVDVNNENDPGWIRNDAIFTDVVDLTLPTQEGRYLAKCSSLDCDHRSFQSWQGIDHGKKTLQIFSVEIPHEDIEKKREWSRRVATLATIIGSSVIIFIICSCVIFFLISIETRYRSDMERIERRRIPRAREVRSSFGGHDTSTKCTQSTGSSQPLTTTTTSGIEETEL